MTKHIPIRRDGTFEFKGVRYQVSRGSDRPERDGERWVQRINSDEPGDVTMVADSFGYMSEVRDWIQTAIDEDWPDLDELGATNSVTSQGDPRIETDWLAPDLNQPVPRIPAHANYVTWVDNNGDQFVAFRFGHPDNHVWFASDSKHHDEADLLNWIGPSRITVLKESGWGL